MAAACCVFVVESAVCQTSPARAVGGIEAADSLVSAEFAKDSIGSITVGVVSGSQLVFTRSVGFADINTRRLANRNTVYRIGSITKPFTAVMLMHLIAAGRVQLSDPVERYLPEVKQIAGRPPGASPFAARKGAEIQADIDERFKVQVASSGSETAVRRLIGEIANWEARLRTHELSGGQSDAAAASATRGHDREARST